MGLEICYNDPIEKNRTDRPSHSEVSAMFRPKGYYTSQGYAGFLPDGRRIFFPTMGEYIDYLRELLDEAA